MGNSPVNPQRLCGGPKAAAPKPEDGAAQASDPKKPRASLVVAALAPQPKDKTFVIQREGDIDEETVEKYVYDPALKCLTCRETFYPNDELIEYETYPFHSRCFKCSKCDMSLLELPAVPMTYKKKLYCEIHYNEVYDELNRVCGGCNHRFREGETDILKALNLEWHKKCLACRECGASLAGETVHHGPNFTIGEPVWCKRCYLDEFTDKCHVCARSGRGEMVKVGDKVYHRGCCVCVVCKCKLNSKNFACREETMALYCRKDYDEAFAPKCFKCKKKIERRFKKAFDQMYHPECFVCRACQNPLASGDFDRDPATQDLYCLKDLRKLRAKKSIEKLGDQHNMIDEDLDTGDAQE